MARFLDTIKSFIRSHGVTLGIAIVALLIAHNAVVTYISQKAIDKRNEVEDIQLTVSELLDTQSTLVNLMDLGLRGYYMISEEKFAEPYHIAMEQYEANLDTLKSIMGKVEYPRVDSISLVKKAVSDYALLVGQAINHIKEGNPDEAKALFASDPGYKLWMTYSPIIQDIQSYVDDLNRKSKSSYDNIVQYSIISQSITFLIGIPVLIIVLIRLMNYEKKTIGLFANLQESKEQYIFKEKHKNVDRKTLESGVVINDMINNLKKATDFIQDVSKGNFSVKWEGMTEELKKDNEGTIAGELIKMRDQLKSVKEEDEKRQWITEGVAKFSDLIRENKNDFEKLTKEVISFIVNYTDSNQGGLYLLNEEGEDDPFIELVSCYAYDKHKYLSDRIELGSGLLGQVFLEGELAIYKDLPGDYMKITSGIGEALPKNIVIVPIRMDEKTVGIFELASFSEYTEKHTLLLQRISLTLASEIVSGKSEKVMKKLFEKSKENEEMMRSQEEEMRQNMEELQATQEEQDRQKKELEEKIMELEAQLDNKIN